MGIKAKATLADIRVKKGLSKTDLAKLTDITPGHLSRIEHGKARPSPALAKRIQIALEVEWQDIFFHQRKAKRQVSRENEA